MSLTCNVANGFGCSSKAAGRGYRWSGCISGAGAQHVDKSPDIDRIQRHLNTHPDGSLKAPNESVQREWRRKLGERGCDKDVCTAGGSVRLTNSRTAVRFTVYGNMQFWMTDGP